MKAYTDYPMSLANGHVINSEVVQVEVLSYDRNKYCWVKWKDEFHEIKSGYLFLDPELSNRSWKWLYTLPNEIYGKHPTHHQVAAELKEIRKKSTRYIVYDNNFGQKAFSRLSSALNAMRNLESGELIKHSRMYKVESLLTKTEGKYTIHTDRKDHSVLKRRHVNRYLNK